MNSKLSENKDRTTIYLPSDLHAELRIEAIRQRMTMTEFILKAINHELSQITDTKKKEKRVTGSHVTKR